MMAAWIPFLQPIPQLVGGWYLLCIPLVVGVSMVYRAIWTDQDGFQYADELYHDG